MDKIIIQGGQPLHGTIKISGAKNSALPLMAAALLTKDTLELKNVPQLSDIVTMSHLLINHGVKLSICGMESSESINHKVFLNAEKIDNFEAPYEIVKKMRASILVLGPLLARFGFARVSMPGGCAIGTRPVNLHIKAMEALGAKVDLYEGYIEATAKNGLKGAEIHFENISVGATENALMAAVLASGKTVIKNAAMEPEIGDLARMLNAMGAKISGIDRGTLEIEGVSELHGTQYKVIFDRIEAGTYAAAAMITGGEITLENIDYNLFANISAKLSDIGARITKINDNKIIVASNGSRKSTDIITGAYPGFPTDLQAQFMTLLSVSEGKSSITENIFENRYMHVPELSRMGAQIETKGGVAYISGVNNFYGAEVMATDLRASVSLILAGLAAKGETIINRVYHLDRGYEKIEEKFGRCGANILRLTS
ncbi:MAG: UDP-N-acetylglucosamine 1-carboxyvinyltransferase [Alphaproteobacteria bacterium]|nr:UDP-N-acetylglucosamine 1-carboxyvinyltransferase [Alphaproteobacteria bacterium]